jgi:multidrug efflux pump
MSVGTLLTIFVIPTVYLLLARKRVPGEITTPAVHPPQVEAVTPH